MFKQFVKENAVTGYNDLLNEELNDAQKAVVDSWGENKKAKKISKNAIPEGQDRTYIPLEHPDDNKPVEPHPDVKAHLEKHGYKITDYKGNKAVEPKYGREIRIGKALAATNASKELVSTFNNDPKRAASNSGKLGVVISRHPHDVAGMSTDRGWRSCMRMGPTGTKKGAGEYSHYLKHDVQQGTHVAYLVHEHDKEAKSPLARIALKPFHSEDKKDTILRPEDSQYGTSDHAFGHTVRKWAETNFPAKDDKVYRKSKKLYNDDQKDIVASPSTSLKSKDPRVRAATFDNKDVTPEHITQGLNDKDAQVPWAAIHHPNANAEHITKALRIDHTGIRAAAVEHPNATAEHITQGLNDPSDTVRMSAIKNKNVTAEHLSKVLDNPDSERNLRIAALKHPNLPSKEITKVLNKPNGHPNTLEKEVAIKHPKVTPEHINKALDVDNHSDVRNAAIQNPHVKLSSENISKALKDVDPRVRGIAARRPEATAEHITQGLNDEKSYVRGHAINNPNATAEHISKALKDEDSGVRQTAMRNPKANAEHITKALNDENEGVRREAASHPNATAEHITKALRDPDDAVRRRAINNPNANEDHALKASGDKSMFVRNDAEQRLAQLKVADKKKSKEL